MHGTMHERDAAGLLFIYFFRKKHRTIKRKKRSHKGRGLATCRRRKIAATIAVELRQPARNSSHIEDSSPLVVV